jgi:hypothetical protein
MIIILALALFLIVRFAIRVVVMSRKRFSGSGGGAGHGVSSRRRTTPIGSGGVQDWNPQIDAWTVLDDIQLNRLLKDSAPRPNS